MYLIFLFAYGQTQETIKNGREIKRGNEHAKSFFVAIFAWICNNIRQNERDKSIWWNNYLKGGKNKGEINWPVDFLLCDCLVVIYSRKCKKESEGKNKQRRRGEGGNKLNGELLWERGWWYTNVCACVCIYITQRTEIFWRYIPLRFRARLLCIFLPFFHTLSSWH